MNKREGGQETEVELLIWRDPSHSHSSLLTATPQHIVNTTGPSTKNDFTTFIAPEILQKSTNLSKTPTSLPILSSSPNSTLLLSAGRTLTIFTHLWTSHQLQDPPRSSTKRTHHVSCQGPSTKRTCSASASRFEENRGVPSIYIPC